MKTSLFVLASTAFNWPVTTALNVNDPKLTFTPTPNAIEDLQAHDLWVPNMTAFAEGKPNVENLNLTAENEKAAASGLNITDLVVVVIADDADAPHALEVVDEDCDKCKKCHTVCLGLIWMVIFYPICMSGCDHQAYCDGC